MGDTVLACVVVSRKAEFRVRGLSSDKLVGSLLGCSTSTQSRDGGISINRSGVLVLGLDDHAELVQVNGTLRERGRTASVRVGIGAHGGHGGQSGDESRTHDGNEGLGTTRRVNDWG